MMSMSPAKLKLHISLPTINTEDLKTSCAFNLISTRNILKIHGGSKLSCITPNVVENHFPSAVSSSIALSDRYCYQLVDNP